MSGGGNPSFTYVRELGRGAFGSVVLALDASTQQPVAVKKIPRAQVQGYTESELINHSMLRHPHIVRFHQVFVSPSNLNIVMEYVPDGSLLAHVQQQGRLPEPQARWLFQQLMLALDYCHKVGVANRDIKLDNILLDKSAHGKPDWPILKVCDWGYAKHDAMSLATSRVGTVAYMAPEVLASSGGQHYDGKLADVWSCGVVLYTLLVGGMPFRPPAADAIGAGMVQLLDDMRTRRYRLPSHLSEAASSLLDGLLCPDPAGRLSLAGVTAHPWFAEGLPPNALGMNDGYLRLPRACAQSEADIRSIVLRAVATADGGPPAGEQSLVAPMPPPR